MGLRCFGPWITLDRSLGAQLGIDVVNDGATFLIDQIHRGLVRDWNQAYVTSIWDICEEAKPSKETK